MISGVGFTYVLLPCLGATAMAALLPDWRLIAAAAFGALGVFAIGGSLPDLLRLISLPILAGVIVGALFVGPRLAIRPTSDIWSRMLWAIVPTFVIAFLFLALNVTGA